MLNPLTVDRLEILVLVDNLTDSLSTNPANVTAEWTGLMTGGRMRMIAGENICCAHHGLSLLIVAHVGEQKHTLLFDAGPEGATFLRNTRILGVDFKDIGAIVLSHGHWDHAGGLVAAVEAAAQARPTQGMDCYVHPGMFAQRATPRQNGELLVHEPVPDPQRLAKAGARVTNTREPQRVAGGAFYVSGEIPRKTSYEKGLPGQLRRSEDGQSWEPDPLLMDERYLSVHVKDKGQFVFSACSHAGLINVLNDARATFPEVPLYGVMGGLHLSGSTEKIIPETIADLKKFGLRFLAPDTAPAGGRLPQCPGYSATNWPPRPWARSTRSEQNRRSITFGPRTWRYPCRKGGPAGGTPTCNQPRRPSMRSLRWAIALGSIVLLSAASAWSLEAPLQPGRAPNAAHAGAPALNLLAQSDRQKCVVAIKLCWQQCTSQNREYSDAWKACREKCGHPGHCD